MGDSRAPDQPAPRTDQPRQEPGIQANEAHGRVVLVRPADGGFYLLDELGARIWELCDGEHSIEQVIAAVGAESDQPASAVAGDVREWISELRTEGLIVEPTPG